MNLNCSIDRGRRAKSDGAARSAMAEDGSAVGEQPVLAQAINRAVSARIVTCLATRRRPQAAARSGAGCALRLVIAQFLAYFPQHIGRNRIRHVCRRAVQSLVNRHATRLNRDRNPEGRRRLSDAP